MNGAYPLSWTLDLGAAARCFAPPFGRHFFRHAGPLYHFNRKDNILSDRYTGDFFLNSSLYIEDNTLLNITGEDYGGDVNRFFLVN